MLRACPPEHRLHQFRPETMRAVVCVNRDRTQQPGLTVNLESGAGDQFGLVKLEQKMLEVILHARCGEPVKLKQS